MIRGKAGEGLQYGLESVAGGTGLVPHCGEMFEVAEDLTFVPRQQDRLDVWTSRSSSLWPSSA